MGGRPCDVYLCERTGNHRLHPLSAVRSARPRDITISDNAILGSVFVESVKKNLASLKTLTRDGHSSSMSDISEGDSCHSPQISKPQYPQSIVETGGVFRY